MPRSVLDEAHVHPAVRETVANSHSATVREVQAAVAAHPVVIVGMAQNPWLSLATQPTLAKEAMSECIDNDTASYLETPGAC